jgi:hypothetical protein
MASELFADFLIDPGCGSAVGLSITMAMTRDSVLHSKKGSINLQSGIDRRKSAVSMVALGHLKLRTLLVRPARERPLPSADRPYLTRLPLG